MCIVIPDCEAKYDIHFIYQTVKQFLLEFVSPISVHHGVNLMAAIAVVWNDRRQRGTKRVSSSSMRLLGEGPFLFVMGIFTLRLKNGSLYHLFVAVYDIPHDQVTFIVGWTGKVSKYSVQ